PRRRDVAYLQTLSLISQKEEARIQLQAEEFDIMVDAEDLDKIEEVNANCILMANLQQSLTSGTQTDKALVYDLDGSAKKMALGYKNLFYLKQAQQKQYSLYNGKVVLEKHDPHAVYDSEETLQLAQESRLKMKQLNKEIKPENYAKINQLSEAFVSQKAKSREELYFLNTSKIASVPKSMLIPNEEFSDDTSPSVARKFLNEFIPKVGESNALLKPVTSNSTPSTRESKVMKNDNVISLGLFRINPSKTSRIDNVMPNKPVKESTTLLRLEGHSLGAIQIMIGSPLHLRVVAISPDKVSREAKKVPNTVSASSRTKPITVLQPFVITKKGMNSNSNGFSSTGIDNTKTRRPQPRSNTKNDRVPSASKSSRSKNKEVKVEEHHRNLLLSKKNKHMSSACNSSKIDSQDVKSKVVCAKCKKCLNSVNHNVCLNNYVNGKKSRGRKHKANVSKNETQKKYQPKASKPKKDVKSKVVCAKCKKCLNSVNHDVCLNNCVHGKKSSGRKHKANASKNETQKESRPKVSKSKNVGPRESLATPKPRKPRFLLRWSPTGKMFDSAGKLVAPSGCSKHMTGNLKLLINFVWKFMGTVRFGNDHVAAILGFGDLQWGNILITRVYFIEGLGHNLFSVGQFCDSDLEVTFRRNACFVRNLDRVDLLKGDRSTNLYTINLHEMASASPICLMARASFTKSWLWHQRLSHLNFDTINDLARNDLVACLPKFKYLRVSKEKAKEHLIHQSQFQIQGRD
nr:ribonuclease H-like domain-containing protein [Tanacetum cinerariifolium]